MSYKLLIEKLLLDKKKIVTREEIIEYCKKLNLHYNLAISYLLSNKHIVRILRGIFYVKNIEERKNNTLNISFYDAISEAMRIKKINNWYFGLESAIKLNNLTHEYFTTEYIISDKIRRPKSIEILGRNVRFLMLKEELTNFGVNNNGIPYSDTEKTILDIAYLGIYNSLSDISIKNKLSEYIENCNKPKLLKYARKYPKTELKLIESFKHDKKRNN